MGVLGGWAFSFGRGTPVQVLKDLKELWGGGSQEAAGTGGIFAASVHDKHSVGPPIRPFCAKCNSTLTNLIQVCSNFR